MRTSQKASSVLGKENKRALYFILFINTFVFAMEFLSIMSIPLFTSALLDTDSFLKKYDFLSNSYIKDNFVFISSIFVIATFLLKNFFLMFGRYVTYKYLKKLKIELSMRLFNFYSQSNLLNIQSIKPSIMYRNVVHEVTGFYSYLLNFNKLIQDVSAVVVIFIILLTLNPNISLTLIGVFSLLTYFYFKFLRPYLKHKAKKNQDLIANFNKSISETFEAIRDIKIFQKEKAISDSFKKDVTKLEENQFFFRIFDTIPRILLEIISIILILVVALAVFTKSTNSENFIEYIPILVLIIVSCIRLIPAFSGINLSLFYLRVYARSVHIVWEQLNKIKLNLNNKTTQEKIDIVSFKKDLDIVKSFLVIDNISFRYDNHQSLLKNINLVIPKKSFVALVGKTGSGKTTLQHIMMGLIKPDKGNIFFQNQNIHCIYEKWISKIGYVSQKVFLFDDTIEKNICLNFENDKVDQDRLNEAIQISELSEKISSFENKIHQQIGTDGNNLSGGERQRIAIARAVYKKSEILFLDEFTSSLDNLTQEKIINNLKNKLPDATIIMISHRPDINEKCDLVIKLDDK